MGLDVTLSALRYLILDIPELPGDLSLRKAAISTRFPALSKEEVEDLARIEPGRLSIYTRSIFLARIKLLKNNFPRSFAVIQREWERSQPKPFSGYDFVREMHYWRPWKGNETKELVAGLVEFVREKHAEIVKAAPWLRDLLSMEHAAYLVFRAESPAEKTSKNVQDLAPYSVGDLLSLTGYMSNPVRLLQFEHDMSPLLSRGEGHNIIVPEKRDSFFACSRGAELRVRWTEISREVYELLIRRGQQGFLLEELAVAFAENSTAEGEEELFIEFAGFLRRLVERGVCGVK